MMDLLELNPNFFYSAIGLLGLIVGSFLNVLAYRLPRMMQRQYPAIINLCAESPLAPQLNLCSPASHCPQCHHRLTILDNLPLLSYLLMKGRCRYCKKTIACRYPLMELLSLISAIIIAVHFGATWQTPLALVFTWGLLALAIIDWEHGILPDQITISFIWLGLLVSLAHGFCDSQAAIVGAIVGYISFWFIAWMFFKVTKKVGMGHGDFKLLAMLGAWLGWQQLPCIILLASLLGSVAGISLLAFTKQHRETPLPFGPYLALGGWITLLWGKNWLQWWLTL